MLRIENKDNELICYVSGVMTDDTCKEISDSIKLGNNAGIKDVTMYINSYGGSVAGAYDIISTIKSSNIKLTAINTGFAISAASILLASANVSKAYNYSTAMIHNPLAGSKSLNETKGKTKNLLQAVKDGIIAIYRSKFNKSEEELSEMMNKETSLNAQGQLETGLVDEVITNERKPEYSNELEDVEVIWNVIETFNNEHIHNKINMTKKVEVEETVTEPVSNELEEKVSEMETIISNLKVENFILKNKMETKTELIENAVKTHGVEVLNTIKDFISDNTAIENVLEVVNDTNDVLDTIISTKVTTDLTAEAERYFGMDADPDLKHELRAENEHMYNKLHNIYFEIDN